MVDSIQGPSAGTPQAVATPELDIEKGVDVLAQWLSQRELSPAAPETVPKETPPSV